MFAGYLRLIVFAFGLLLGVQIPAFVDQYAKRVSAHEIEATRSFQSFQDIATRYFGGSVEALIAHHRESTDPAFKDEARGIQALFDRLMSLRAELAALRGPFVQQLAHIALHPNREILRETWNEYSYTVPLSPTAIVMGVACGTAMALLIELLLLGLVRLATPSALRRPA
jgi:hypothetical protein